MKTKQVYICEICKTSYDVEATAIECEESHEKVKDIRYDYKSLYRYPDKIRVAFENGTFVDYKK